MLRLILGLCAFLIVLLQPRPGSCASDYARVPAASSIEVRAHDFEVIQRSVSARVYLVGSDTLASELPAVGKVFLARKKNQPFMGLRVLKVYPETRRFAVKKIKEYQRGSFLARDTQVPVIEKVGDLSENSIPPVSPQERAQDVSDLRELEASGSATGGAAGAPPAQATLETPPGGAVSAENAPQTQKFDPDLDAGVTPQSEPPQFDGSGEDDLSELEDIVVRESIILDPESRWLSTGISFIRSGKADGTNPYLPAGAVGYGFDLGKRIAFSSNRLQDSFTLEGMLHFYQVVDTATYTVMPVTITARYNLFTSENLAYFGYAGLQKGILVSLSDVYDEAEADALDAFIPAFGVGLFFKVGPNWMARFDLGFDKIGVGLVLRF